MHAIRSLVPLACVGVLSLAGVAISQDAAPADRKAVKSRTAASGGMAADSPVTFPSKGSLSDKHRHDIRVTSYPTEQYFSMFGSPCRSVESIARIQQEMTPGSFTPPPADWEHLSRTYRKLTEGGDVHILGLGDSIMNDTMRSGWLSSLQHAYPKAKIRGTVYVRSGGGCQHFVEGDRIQRFLIPMKPDVVFIGGISQKDVALIREAIHQIRAGLPDVEILLATGAFGTADPRSDDELAKANHSGTGAYGQALRQLARDEKCAYLDMTTPWAQYIRSSGVHPHLFYRDPIHANEYGEQILNKILIAFWTAPR